MKNTDDTLREQLRNKLNEYESPVPDALWQNVATQLPQAKYGAGKFSLTKVAAIVVSGAVLTAAALLVNKDKTEIVEQLPPAPNATHTDKAQSLPVIENQPIIDSVAYEPTPQPVNTNAGDKTSLPPNTINEVSEDVSSTVSTTLQRTMVVQDMVAAHGDSQPLQASLPPESPTKADARFSVVETDQSGLTFFFIPQHTSATTYRWTFGDGESSTELSPSHHYDDPGEYTVNLTMEVNGGLEEFQQTVTAIPAGKLDVPTIFTPNDDGKNDTFDVASLSRYVTIEAVHIFNTEGTLVYSGTSDDAWGGDDMQGNQLPDGNYIYKINAKDLRQQPVEKSGTVYLRR